MHGESSFRVQTDEFIDCLMDLMRYRRRTMTLLPAEIRRKKDQFEKLHPGDGSKRSPHHDLFYQIGLTILFRHKGPVTMGELSKELLVPLSTATRIVDGLIKSGLAQRTADPEDRRVVRVTLSEEGRELYQVMNEYFRQRIDQLLSPLTAEERAQFISLLRKAVHGLAENSG